MDDTDKKIKLNFDIIPLYVIIECGFEGIEKLLYATTDSHDVVKKINEIRKNVIDSKEYKKNFLKKFDDGVIDEDDLEDIWGDMYVKGEVEERHYINVMKNIDLYCVQKWDGKNFFCFCEELKCNP